MPRAINKSQRIDTVWFLRRTGVVTFRDGKQTAVPGWGGRRALWLWGQSVWDKDENLLEMDEGMAVQQCERAITALYA